MKYIYVTITATPCFTGRFIRTITNSNYNHVSLCFEPTLKELYSFARRYKSTPFCGGFVKESANRYKQKGRVAKLLLHKIPVTDEEYDNIILRIEDFLYNNEEYVYNNLAAVMSLLHLKIQVKNSYTCVEFVAEQLKDLSALKRRLTKKFYSIDSLREALSPFLVYSGRFPIEDGDWGDDRFNQKLSVKDIISEELSDGRKLATNLVVTVYPEMRDMVKSAGESVSNSAKNGYRQVKKQYRNVKNSYFPKKGGNLHGKNT